MAEITIKDIAKLCGVGVSTVSRALNNHPDINPETKEKIMQVIKENGFVPNNSARNLKRVEAKSVAVLVKGITNPFFSDMISVIEAEIEKRGFTLVLHHVESREDEVEVALELVKEKRLQGIIFLGGEFAHSEEKLGLLSVPFVFSTAGTQPENLNLLNYSSISVDDKAESSKVINFLYDIGHRKIAIITAQSEDQSVGRLRLDGYREALMQRGVEINEKLICALHPGEKCEQFSMENGYVATKELLAKTSDFTALFAISDVIAIGACRALKEAGIKVPEQVSVIGYDGIDMGDYFNPRLTTLKQPTKEMALATVNLLFDILNKKKSHQHLMFPGELIIRESTKAVSE